MTPHEAAQLDRLLDETTATFARLMHEAKESDETRDASLKEITDLHHQSLMVATRAEAIVTSLRLRPAKPAAAGGPGATAAASLHLLRQTVGRMETVLRTLESLEGQARRVRDQWYRFW